MLKNFLPVATAALLMLCLSTSLMAQHKINFGVQAGYVLSDFDYRTSGIKANGLSASSSSGAAVNLIVSKPISDKFTVSLEPGFIMKGYTEHSLSQPDIKLQFSYLHLPVMFNYRLFPKVQVELGPELAQRIQFNLNGNKPSDISKTIWDRNFELSGIVGLRYRLQEHLEVGLRYNHGITPVASVDYTDEVGVYGGHLNEYNQYYQAFLRWRI